MKLIISENYRAYCDSSLLGYQGEKDARTIKVAQPHIDEATAYRLIFDCGNDVIYEVDVTGGEYIVDGGLLINVGTVKCQWQAVKLVGDTYELVAKSNIIEFAVKPSIQGDVAPIPTYEQSKSALDEVLKAAEQAQDAEAAAERAEIAAGAATEAAEVAEQAKTEAVNSAATATQKAAEAEQSAISAAESANAAEQSKTAAETAANSANQSAETASANAVEATQAAESAEKSSQEATDKAAEISASAEQIAENAVEIEDVKAYIGYTDEDIVGLCVDYENKMFTRLAGAVGKNQGEDFDIFPMYGGRRRCNVADDGTINAYYGDQNYTEDGTNGQVMVYQPKFYYKVVPLKLDKNTESGLGYHIRKANYYVSATPKAGFKLHPAFYDESGNEIDYILLSAYEGSMFDASADAYVNDSVDESIAYAEGDLLCSIAGKKPISGLRSGMGTKESFESMAQNRGSGWHLETIKATSANQLLMIVELGTMNTQTGIGSGVTGITHNSAYNCSSLTGSTADLGNGTGQAAETINEIGGAETPYTTAGKVSVSYRGVENPWGNIWKHIQGVNIWGDGTMGGGQPYIANNFTFNESKNSDNYEPVGFTLANASGYINAMGYGNEEFDWLLMPSEIGGTSALPVGDYTYATANLNGYRVALFGGCWYHGTGAGGFCWGCHGGVGTRTREIGGRLLYVPSAKRKGESNV